MPHTKPSQQMSPAQTEAHIADLEQRLRQKTLEAEALRRVGGAIGRLLDLPQMLQMVSEIIVDVTDTDLCLVYLLNESRSELILSGANRPAHAAIGKVRMKLGEGVTGWVAQTREHVALDREAYRDARFKLVPELKQDRYHSMLSVPLLGHSDLIGVINVRTNREHEYSTDQVELLESIAAQVAGAIENSAEFQRVQQRASHLSTLSEISRTISSSQYLEEILQFIVAVTAESMGLSIVSVMLLNDQGSELIIKATTSHSREYTRKPNLPLNESLAGKAVVEKKPVQVLDVKRTPGYRYPDIARKEGLCSLICVPMAIKNRIIGVLNCYTSKPHTFGEDEVSLLSALSAHAAIAIENAQLHVRSAVLQEMHHRVKNNLQTVASLLRLQMRYGKQVTVESALSESIHRIQSIALVHDMLSREDLHTVSVRKLAETISSAHASSSLPAGHQVQVHVDGPNLLLPSHQATSIALILNELIQNAMEHGITEDHRGFVKVNILEEGESITILVENQGRPLPEGFDIGTHRNLGLQIVESLVREDLSGSFGITGGPVTQAQVTFRR